MPSYYNIPDGKVAEILDTDFSGLVTAADLYALRQSIQGTDQSAFPQIQTSIDATGGVEVSRAGRAQIVVVDTFSGSSSDEITSINTPSPDPFSDYDLITVVSKSGARTVQIGSNIAPESINLSVAGTFATFMRRAGKWHYMDSNPKPDIQAQEGTIYAIDSTSVDSSSGQPVITLNKSVTFIQSERLGEVAAFGDAKITGTGISGSVTITVDEGAGPFTLAFHSYSGSPTAAVVATALNADSQARKLAGEHGYSSSLSAADTIRFTAPAGYGSLANSYQLEAIITGSATVYIAAFSGGIDGTDQDQSIDWIFGGIEGKIYLIRNKMQGNSITIGAGANASKIVTIPPDSWIIGLYSGSVFQIIYAQLPQVERLLTSTDSPYTVIDGDGLIYVDASTGSVTVNLPEGNKTAACRPLNIKRVAGNNTITADAYLAETIDGSLTQTLANPTGSTLKLKYSKLRNQWEIW